MNGLTDHPLMQALGLAVLHSVWQGILFFCVLKMLLSFVPERRALLKYRILYFSLTSLAVLFCYTFITEWQYSLHTWNSIRQGRETMQAASAMSLHSWQDSMFISYVSAFRRYTPLLAVCYTLGLLALSLKMLRELLQVRDLRREVISPEPFLEQRFIDMKQQAGIGRNVLLRLSAKIQVPLMLGHLKPIVLLPLSLASRLDSQQLEAILLHELAHVRRHDYLWNILQMAMETLLFFNPVAWWLSSLIREEREHCCDDYVLQQTQRSLPYAHALLALEEYRLSRYNATVAFTGGKKSSLLNRIKRITAMKQSKGNSQKILATITVLLLVAAMACFATAFGQDKKDEPKTVTKSYAKKVVTITDDNGNTKVYQCKKGDPAAFDEAMKIMPDVMEIAGNVMETIDWDQIEKNVEGAMAHANTAIEGVDWKVAERSVDKAMKDVDWDEMKSKMDEAKNVDWAAIQNNVAQAMLKAKATVSEEEWKKATEAMESVDWSEMQKAMKEVDWKEIQDEVATAMQEAKQSMEAIDWKQVKAELSQAKEEMKKAMKESKKAMKESNKDMKKAIKEAKEEEAHID